MHLKGRVAFITGGGSGIGKAAAVKLAEHGAKVAVLSRTEEQLKETVDEIKGKGGEALYVQGDVGDASQLETAFDKVIKEWGRLDILLANAGINGAWAPIDELEVEEFDNTIAINLRGTFLSIKFAAPLMKKSGGGAIVVVSSINGTRVFTSPGAVAYGTSKAGQVAITQFMALELAQHKIRVNAVCPGRITTEIEEETERRNPEKTHPPVEYPKGKIPLTGDEPGTAMQVADLINFLVSDESKHITGTLVYIDGGQSLLQG